MSFSSLIQYSKMILLKKNVLLGLPVVSSFLSSVGDENCQQKLFLRQKRELCRQLEDQETVPVLQVKVIPYALA